MTMKRTVTTAVLGRVPKLLGSDVELGNFLLGTGHTDTAEAAARLLLHAIKGVSAERRPPAYGAWGTYGAHESSPPSAFVNPEEWGRRYLPEMGGAAYLDLGHAEMCTPEVTSAGDFVAARHALLRVAQRAQAAVNATLPAGRKLEVLANNSDGLSHSFGSHTSVLLTRRAWENLFERRLHHLLYLAAFQVSSIVFSGSGKVGAENGAPAVDFQLTARGDFFQQLLGVQTTYRRPIVNARDEALSGSSAWGAAPRHLFRQPFVRRVHALDGGRDPDRARHDRGRAHRPRIDARRAARGARAVGP